MRLREPDDADPDLDPVAVVHAALDAGITLLDTAEMYGNEELVGRSIAGRRDEVTLCSKFGVVWGDSGRADDWAVHADAATVVSSCEASLRRLGVDLIDVYYLHHRSEDTPIEETVTALARLVTAGKIRAVGLSNVTVDDIQRAQRGPPRSRCAGGVVTDLTTCRSDAADARPARHHPGRPLANRSRQAA